jgi:hypothetical protein
MVLSSYPPLSPLKLRVCEETARLMLPKAFRRKAYRASAESLRDVAMRRTRHA